MNSNTKQGIQEVEKRIAQIIMEHGNNVFDMSCLEEDIKELLAKEKLKSYFEGSAKTGEIKRTAYLLGYSDGRESVLSQLGTIKAIGEDKK